MAHTVQYLIVMVVGLSKTLILNSNLSKCRIPGLVALSGCQPHIRSEAIGRLQNAHCEPISQTSRS
jgi:hypothetical protein